MRRFWGQDRSDHADLAPETSVRGFHTGPSARTANAPDGRHRPVFSFSRTYYELRHQTTLRETSSWGAEVVSHHGCDRSISKREDSLDRLGQARSLGQISTSAFAHSALTPTPTPRGSDFGPLTIPPAEAPESPEAAEDTAGTRDVHRRRRRGRGGTRREAARGPREAGRGQPGEIMQGVL